MWGGAVLISILFWPYWPMVPEPGLDPGWHAGLAWAAQMGLQWGTDVVFTFGPLGFAQHPWLASNVQIAVASTLHVGACVALTSLAYLLIGRTHAFSALRASAIALAASAVCLAVGVWSTLFAVVVMAGLLSLVTMSMRFIILGGVACALMGHQKLSEAVAAAGFIVLCGLGARRLRGAAIAGGTISVVWIMSWLLLGQQIAHIDDHVTTVMQVTTGYSQAMSLEIPGYQWPYGVAAIVAVLLLVQLRHVARDWHPLQRISIFLAIPCVLWLAFRGGFTRHDEHDAGFFSVVLILSIALLITMIPRRPTWAGAAAASLCYLFFVFVYGFMAIVDRTDGARTLARVLSVTTNPEARAQTWSTAIHRLAEW